MLRHAPVLPLLALLAVAALSAPPARADGLPRLPKAVTLPQGSDSPGKVTFNHDTHVDAAKPSCLACHPSTFKILGRSHAQADKAAAPLKPITHERMEKGEACGRCHGKGKAAFEFEDNCENCHAS
jgi:c(7)-type cytochrome triheme protein